MTKPLGRTLLFLAPITLFAFGGGYQAETTATPRCSSPAASAAADALAAKFDDHQFIFIGSTHGDAKIEEFLACLATRSAFQRRATDIVTEWASSGQQQRLDPSS